MPYLCTSPERKSTSKAPKRVPRVRAMGSIAGFRVPVLYHQLLRVAAIMCQPPTRVSCNFPEFKELHGQTQNRRRPDARHCAASTLGAISAHSDKSTIEETTEGGTHAQHSNGDNGSVGSRSEDSQIDWV